MQGVAALRSKRRVGAGEQPLRRRFLVARRAIDLSSQEQSGHGFELEARAKFARIDVIIFDRITWPDDGYVLEPGQRAQKLLLHLRRERRGEPVGIDSRVVKPFRLKENLVAVAVGEADDFILDGRAIARPPALDAP